MRWFQTNKRFGSRLALVALAIQIFLSFSHIDLCDLGVAPAKASVALGSAPAGPGKGSPADKSDRPASCPICALIQLVATAASPAPPSLPLPIVSGHARPEAADELLLALSPHFLFRARAPPAA